MEPEQVLKGILAVNIAEFFILMITLAGIFFWSRSESRADNRRLEELTASIHQETYQEIKDFHGRLCAIEERKKIGKE
jgi:hypothetical protein